MRFMAWVAIGLTSLAGASATTAAPVDCDKLTHSTEPFQIKRVVHYKNSKGPGETEGVSQVYRNQGGLSVIISASKTLISKSISKYGISFKSHSVDGAQDHHSTTEITGGIKDFMGGKSDYTHESATSNDAKTPNKATFSAKYLGEDDINVGVCFFHVLKYKVTKTDTYNGKLQPVNEEEFSYSPDLRVRLDSKFKVLTFEYSNEMHVTDISTDFAPLPDPGD